MVARGNYGVIKDSTSDRPPTYDFKGSFRSLSQYVQPARDEPMQPEYRHNNYNDCISLAAFLVDRSVGISLCSFEVCLIEI